MQSGIWLTVITVVKDDATGFTRTLESLQRQDLSRVEFLIIDGSADRTQIPGILSTCGFSAEYRWVAPAGIYAAMNEGIALAQGTYSFFANAGDTLFDDEVLARVASAASQEPEWLFGPVEIISVSGESVLTPEWNYQAEKAQCFSRGHFPCHQGTFMRTSTLREVGGFRTDLEIVSDYAMFLEFSRISDPVVLRFPIARFSEGGISTTRWRQSLREFHRARMEILRPRGAVLVREHWNSVTGFARMLAYRGVVSKMRGGAA